MQLNEAEPEPFFEDVVNHMATICSAPMALVALADTGRTWANRSSQERGEEIEAFDLIGITGREHAIIDLFECEPVDWKHGEPPRSLIVTPLILKGAFEGVLVIADPKPRVWGEFEANYMVRAARLVAGHFEARAALVERDRVMSQLSDYQRALDKFAIVSVADASGAILHANEQFCAISGYTHDELVGADHRIVNSGRHPKAFFVDLWRTILSGQMWRGEICNRAKDGSLYWVDSTIVPMTDGAGTKTFVSIRVDRTQKHLAEEKLAAALAALEDERNNLEARVVDRTLALEEAMRAAEDANAAKSAFLATVSHELRTPLHTVISFAEAMKEDIEAGSPDLERTLEDLNVVASASRHLLSLIGGILDFSKVEAGQMSFHAERVELTPLLEDCVTSVRHAASRNGNTVSLEVYCDTREVVTDRMRLKQCLLNLLSNAAKFTTNGTISLIATVVDRRDDRRLRISVTDTGIGMAPAVQERLFQPFYQVDCTVTRTAEGTGLGLALTQRIVRHLGGTLSVQSSPGVGSAFTLELPLSASFATATIARSYEEDGRRTLI